MPLPDRDWTTDNALMRAKLADPALLLREASHDTALTRRAGGRYYTGLCPFHAESSPSFIVFDDSPAHDGYHCFGCGANGHNAADYVIARSAGGLDFNGALAYLGLRRAATPVPRLPPAAVPAMPLPTNKAGRPRRDPDRTHTYADVDGTLRYQILIWKHTAAEAAEWGREKSVQQRRPTADGEWEWKGVAPDAQLLYRLPELIADLAAQPTAPIWVLEGKKDVDTARAAGLVATCNSGGAGQWPEHWSPLLAGRTVVLAPDHDSAGQRHAEIVGYALRAVAAEVRVVQLATAWPALPAHGDVSDFLAAHPGPLLAMLGNVAPALPALEVDPTTGEIREPGQGAAAGLDVAERLLALEARVAALEAYQVQTDRLLTQDGISPADRVSLLLFQRYCDTHELGPGSLFTVLQKDLAAEWGVSPDTVSRWLDRWTQMGIASHSTVTEKEVILRRGEPILDPKTGAVRTRFATHTLAAVRQRPFEATLAISPPGPSGKQHGGLRDKGCPTCHAPADRGRAVRLCDSCRHVHDPATGDDLGTLVPPPVVIVSAPVAPTLARVITVAVPVPLPVAVAPPPAPVELVPAPLPSPWGDPAQATVPDPFQGPCPRCAARCEGWLAHGAIGWAY